MRSRVKPKARTLKLAEGSIAASGGLHNWATAKPRARKESGL